MCILKAILEYGSGALNFGMWIASPAFTGPSEELSNMDFSSSHAQRNLTKFVHWLCTKPTPQLNHLSVLVSAPPWLKKWKNHVWVCHWPIGVCQHWGFSKSLKVHSCSVAVATISNSAQHPQDMSCFTKGADIGQLPGIASRWSVTCCPENDWKRRAENSSGFRSYWSCNCLNHPRKMYSICF